MKTSFVRHSPFSSSALAGLLAFVLLAVGADAMAQSGRQLQITEDSYERGEHYDRFNADSVRECARECDRDRDCRAFNYRVRDGRCDLLDGPSESERNRDYVSGVKERGRPPGQGDHHLHMEVSRDQRQDGRRYDRFETRGVDECSHACFVDADCTAFRYNLNNNRCVLMDRASGTERNRDFVSGVKVRADRPHPAGDTSWDYQNHRACANGYVNCDSYGTCETRGTTRNCRSNKHPDVLWDFDANQPCPQGYVNCDASGGCGQRGQPRDCQRNEAHRRGDIFWDYDTNQPCPRGYVNCDASGACGQRGDASSCR